jgi:hypothetical protein
MGAVGYQKMSAAERFDLWRRYRLGESIGSIARALGRSGPAMDRRLVNTGGIAPAPRCRAARVLSLKEREEVSPCLAAGGTIRGIARTLRRAPSTVTHGFSWHSVSLNLGQILDLWGRGPRSGVKGGVKERPRAIVMAVTDEVSEMQLLVLPLTHSSVRQRTVPALVCADTQGLLHSGTPS